MKLILSQCPQELDTQMFEKSGTEVSVLLQVDMSFVALSAAPRFVQRLGIVSTTAVH